MLELKLQRKRSYTISNEIFLELPNTRKKIRLEKVIQDDQNNNNQKLKNLDEEKIVLTGVKFEQNASAVELSAKLNDSKDGIVEVFRTTGIVPDWVKKLKTWQVLSTSNVTPITDMDFKTDLDFKSNVYDDEYDSNEECDYPENGCYFNCT